MELQPLQPFPRQRKLADLKESVAAAPASLQAAPAEMAALLSLLSQFAAAVEACSETALLCRCASAGRLHCLICAAVCWRCADAAEAG